MICVALVVTLVRPLQVKLLLFTLVQPQDMVKVDRTFEWALHDKELLLGPVFSVEHDGSREMGQLEQAVVVEY